jgi:hypothetical protein
MPLAASKASTTLVSGPATMSARRARALFRLPPAMYSGRGGGEGVGRCGKCP